MILGVYVQLKTFSGLTVAGRSGRIGASSVTLDSKNESIRDKLYLKYTIVSYSAHSFRTFSLEFGIRYLHNQPYNLKVIFLNKTFPTHHPTWTFIIFPILPRTNN